MPHAAYHERLTAEEQADERAEYSKPEYHAEWGVCESCDEAAWLDYKGFCAECNQEED